MGITCPNCGDDIDASGRVEVACACGQRVRLDRAATFEPVGKDFDRKPTEQARRFSVAVDEFARGQVLSTGYRDMNPTRVRFDATVRPDMPIMGAISALAFAGAITGVVVGVTNPRGGGVGPALTFAGTCGLFFVAAMMWGGARQITVVGDVLTIRWRTWGIQNEKTFCLSEVTVFSCHGDGNTAAVHARVSGKQSFLFSTSRAVANYFVSRLNAYLPS